MIDPTAKLGVSRQTIVLGISRSSICYQPRPASDADLKLRQRIDKLNMEHTAITMTADMAQQIASALFVAADLVSQKQALAVDGDGNKKAA